MQPIIFPYFKSHRILLNIVSGSVSFDRVDTWVDQGRQFRSIVSTHGFIRISLSRQSRHMITSGSISFDRVDTWVYQCWFYSTVSIHAHNRVNFIRQSRHMGTSGSINVGRVDTVWQNDRLFVQLRNMSQLVSNLLLSFTRKLKSVKKLQSTESTNEPTRVNQGRHSWHIKQSWSNAVNNFDTSDNQGQSQSTESTHEPIRFKFIRQSQHMSISGSVSVDRVNTWAVQG